MTDSVTSNGLTEFIDSLGGKHFRYKRGYKNVIGKGVELNGQGVQTELMMETRRASACLLGVQGPHKERVACSMHSSSCGSYVPCLHCTTPELIAVMSGLGRACQIDTTTAWY